MTVPRLVSVCFTLCLVVRICLAPTKNDRFFKAPYKHTGSRDYRGCDIHEELQRNTQDLTDPEFHYGAFASGNSLVTILPPRQLRLERASSVTFLAVTSRGDEGQLSSFTLRKWDRESEARVLSLLRRHLASCTAFIRFSPLAVLCT